MKKKIPKLKTDKAAEAFVEDANLADYDLSDFRTARFEFEKKDARVNMRLPPKLLEAVRKQAKQRGIPYQRFIREALERAIAAVK